MPKVSVIIRTKNEERWLAHCLKALSEQDFKDFEVILVDNHSEDHTVEIAKRLKVDKLISIDKFLPGKAINDGVRISSGEYIVCLSAHCVPTNSKWLTVLVDNFSNNPTVAGVYGRQLPVSFTEDADKRDLLMVFGQDKRVQVKDYFFHNANSAIRKDVWEKFPFDEEVTNIEDRVWGKKVISNGYTIIYEPDAAVFHHHGLHHGNIKERVRGVTSIIKQVDSDVFNELPESMKPASVNVFAVLPIPKNFDSKDVRLLISATDSLKKSKYLKDIYLLSCNDKLSMDLGVKWLDRLLIPDNEELGIDALLKHSLDQIESSGVYPDALLYVNYEYIFRPEYLVDELIKDAQYSGCDTLFPAYLDYGHYWIKDHNDNFIETDSSMKSRSKREPIFRALYGLGCMTSSVIIRKGKLVGGRVGILPLDSVEYTYRVGDLPSINGLVI